MCKEIQIVKFEDAIDLWETESISEEMRQFVHQEFYGQRSAFAFFLTACLSVLVISLSSAFS